MSDERLRNAYRQILQERAASGRASPVDIEEMVALIERRGSEADRIRLLDRIMASEDTRREFELLRAVASSARPRASSVGWSAASISRSRWALAASALLTVGLGSAWLVRRATSADEPRGGSGVAVSLVSPADGEATAALRFTWRHVPTARSYRFELLDADGTPRAMQVTSDTTLTLASSLGLAPGAGYRWWVIATLGDESVVAALPRRLTIRRAP